MAERRESSPGITRRLVTQGNEFMLYAKDSMRPRIYAALGVALATSAASTDFKLIVGAGMVGAFAGIYRREYRERQEDNVRFWEEVALDDERAGIQRDPEDYSVRPNLNYRYFEYRTLRDRRGAKKLRAQAVEIVASHPNAEIIAVDGGPVAVFVPAAHAEGVNARREGIRLLVIKDERNGETVRLSREDYDEGGNSSTERYIEWKTRPRFGGPDGVLLSAGTLLKLSPNNRVRKSAISLDEVRTLQDEILAGLPSAV